MLEGVVRVPDAVAQIEAALVIVVRLDFTSMVIIGNVCQLRWQRPLLLRPMVICYLEQRAKIGAEVYMLLMGQRLVAENQDGVFVERRQYLRKHVRSQWPGYINALHLCKEGWMLPLYGDHRRALPNRLERSALCSRRR